MLIVFVNKAQILYRQLQLCRDILYLSKNLTSRRTRYRGGHEVTGAELNQEKAQRLYSEGKSDIQIARALQVPAGDVREWREGRGLPQQGGSSKRAWDTQRAMDLYEEGLSDDLIGEHVGTTSQAVHNWRVSLGLPPHPRKRWSREEARRLLEEGYTDTQIAAMLGTTANAVACFRFSDEAKAASQPTWDTEYGRKLYEEGLTDKLAAQKIGITIKTFGDWRRKNGLPPNRTITVGPTRKWDTQQAEVLFREGRSDQEIADAVHTTLAAVAAWRRENGYVKGIRRRSWDTARAREMYEAGASDGEIADAVGTTRGAVRAWRRMDNLTRK